MASALIGLAAPQGVAQTTRPGEGTVTKRPAHSNKPPAHVAPIAKPVAKPPAVTPPPIPIPPVPPPAPSLPPPIVVPVRPPPAPLPATVMLNAVGEAMPEKDGLRLTFGPDAAALNPATDAAIRALAHAPQVVATTDFTITAFAKGVPDDPSAARRLSLSRALAVRSVLINEGVTSLRIYVKALGAPPPEDMPPDRVDVVTSQNVPVAKPSQ